MISFIFKIGLTCVLHPVWRIYYMEVYYLIADFLIIFIEVKLTNILAYKFKFIILLFYMDIHKWNVDFSQEIDHF
jgi:hypothetical protein